MKRLRTAEADLQVQLGDVRAGTKEKNDRFLGLNHGIDALRRAMVRRKTVEEMLRTQNASNSKSPLLDPSS